VKYGPRFTVSGHKKRLVDIRACGTCSVEHVCTELPHVCTVCVQMCVQFERVKSEETRGL
jgi:hypothetical protein